MLKKFLSEDSRLKVEQILAGLPAKEQELLIASAVTQVYQKGETVFKENGIPAGIYFLRNGLVKKYKTTAKGRELIFYVCGTSEMMGYHALLAEDRYSYSASTLSDSQITFVPKDNFLAALQNSPYISSRLLKGLGHEFGMLINFFTTLAVKPVRERLALALLMLDQKFQTNGQNDKGHHNAIIISRSDLANIVGTAKENLVRQLQEFAQAGLITKTSNSIRIINPKGVMREANVIN